MPIIKAAIKHLRQSEKRRAVNRNIKVTLKNSIKDLMRLAQQKKFDELKTQLPKTMSIIDKAVKANIIHKNNAARKKSKFARMLTAVK